MQTGVKRGIVIKGEAIKSVILPPPSISDGRNLKKSKKSKMTGRSIQIHNREYIAVMPEEEVRGKVNQLRGWIESDRRRGNDTLQLEVEYCYLADEMKIRDARKNAHDDYMRNNPQNFNEFYYDSN
jgi:hypothetical protein